MNLWLRVNHELVLDACTTEELSGSERVVHPPQETLFRQVLDYLPCIVGSAIAAQGSTVEGEAAAAAAVVLRRGVLPRRARRQRQVRLAEARSPAASRVCNSEMARINIEASAALAEWIDIFREDRSRYENLAALALTGLPFPRMRPRPVGSDFVMLAMPEVAARITGAIDVARRESPPAPRRTRHRLPRARLGGPVLRAR